MSGLPHVGADLLRSVLPMGEAIAAIDAVLAAGLDPEADPPRAVVGVPAGQILVMPASSARYAGVKIAGVAPGNPARGLPRITGTYLLLDGDTLQPLATFDGPTLTALRTPAVSAVAVAALTDERPLDVLVYGTGPQARGHVEGVLAVRAIRRLRVTGRAVGRGDAFVAWCAGIGVSAEVADASAVAGADLIVCCTTAAEPLFDGALVADGVTVVAMGSHEPTVRELDAALVRRCELYVEARSAALREAGDLLMAGIDDSCALVNLAELRTACPARGRPRLFKSVGMAWEDLAVAAAGFERLTTAAQTVGGS